MYADVLYNRAVNDRPAKIEGLFTPQDKKYLPSKAIEVDAALRNDKVFVDELEKLSKTVWIKPCYRTLRAADELAQQQLIAEAKPAECDAFLCLRAHEKTALRSDAERDHRLNVHSSPG